MLSRIQVINEHEACQYAFAIGRDAAEKARKADDRQEWNEADYLSACKAYHEFLGKLGYERT